ncbi:MAG: hypothetical protein QHH75_02980 [Bacillota bacterium]|nr:hypothetical protein [Bacillota bacterium]
MKIEQLSFPQLRRELERLTEDLFSIKILKVKGETVIASARGSLWEVRTQTPLVPGQVFLVKQEDKENQITWRILQEIRDPAMSSPPEVKPEQLEFRQEAQNYAILSVLHNAGLPVSEKSFFLIQQLLLKLGDFSRVNLLIAATLVRLALFPQPFLLQSLASFFEKAVSQNRLEPWQGILEQDTGENTRRFFSFRLATAVDQLQDLLSKILQNSRKPFENSQQCVSLKLEGNLGKQLLGGQIFAWAQEHSENQAPFFYLPFFILDQDVLPKSEILIYPSLRGATASPECCFLLSLETSCLGWIQVELTFQNSILRARALVEQKEAKALFDELWPQLAASLRNLNFCFYWLGCTVGTVKTTFFKLQNDYCCVYPGVNLVV